MSQSDPLMEFPKQRAFVPVFGADFGAALARNKNTQFLDRVSGELSLSRNSLNNSGRMAAQPQQISFQELMSNLNPEPNNRFYMHSSTGSNGL